MELSEYLPKKRPKKIPKFGQSFTMRLHFFLIDCELLCLWGGWFKLSRPRRLIVEDFFWGNGLKIKLKLGIYI